MRALELALRDDELGGQNLNYCNIFLNRISYYARVFMKTRFNDTTVCFLIWSQGSTETSRYRDVLPPTQPEVQSSPCHGRPLH